jgi:hypothetical protein
MPALVVAASMHTWDPNCSDGVSAVTGRCSAKETPGAAPKRKLVTFLLPMYAFACFCIVVSLAAAEDALGSTGLQSALWPLGALALALLALISGWFAVLGTKHWKDLPSDEDLAGGTGGVSSTPKRPPVDPAAPS